MLGHVSGVNLIRAIRFETRQSRNVLVTIRSHLAIAVDIYVIFLVENPAAEVKFHFDKIRRLKSAAIGVAARTGGEKRNLFV